MSASLAVCLATVALVLLVATLAILARSLAGRWLDLPSPGSRRRQFARAMVQLSTSVLLAVAVLTSITYEDPDLVFFILVNATTTAFLCWVAYLGLDAARGPERLVSLEVVP